MAREWLVIEDSRSRSVFRPGDLHPPGYVPRDAAEKLLGRDLGNCVWFTKEESELLHACSEWRETEPPGSAPALTVSP